MAKKDSEGVNMSSEQTANGQLDRESFMKKGDASQSLNKILWRVGIK